VVRRHVLIALCSLIAGGCLVPNSAIAAPTRADYITQADAVCLSFVDSEGAALRAYHQAYHAWIRSTKKRSIKPFIRLTHRVAGTLFSFNRVHSSMTEQVAAIQPPDADVSLIATWLNGRRQADALSDTAATALNRFRVNKFFALTARADKTEAAGARAINGFGFHVCGVFA
jgi:hypothetical protein